MHVNAVYVEMSLMTQEPTMSKAQSRGEGSGQAVERRLDVIQAYHGF